MSKIIYIIPWAICHTDCIYEKKVERDNTMELKPNQVIDEWIVEKIIPNPDRRNKDMYVLLDVYCGNKVREKGKEVAIIELSNSVSNLTKYGYESVDDEEKQFLRTKILKWDKPMKKTIKKAEKQGKKK